MRAFRRHSGFTLLELVIVIVLLGILAVLGSNMVGDTMQTARTYTQNHATGSQVRWAMERLAREIREIGYGVSGGYSISSKAGTSMTFTKENGTVVSIRTVTNADSSLTLQLGYAGSWQPLTDQVSAFTLKYYDQFGGCPVSGDTACVLTSNNDVRFVEVTISVANSKTGKTDSLRSRIFLRNAQNSA